MKSLTTLLERPDLDSADVEALADVVKQDAYFTVTFDGADQCPDERLYFAHTVEEMLKDVTDHLQGEDAYVAITVGYRNRWSLYLGQYGFGAEDPTVAALLSLANEEDSDA